MSVEGGLVVVAVGSGADVLAGGDMAVVFGEVGEASPNGDRQEVRNRRRATRRKEHGFN